MVSKYKNKYLITTENSTPLPNWLNLWNRVDLGNGYTLMFDSNLECINIEGVSFSINILGPIFDINGNIKNIYDKLYISNDIKEVHGIFKFLSGRYVAIVHDKINNEQLIFSDALSLKQIYYCNKPKLLISGDINMIKEINNLGEKDSDYNLKAKFFFDNDINRVGTGNCWIGNETIFNNVKKLPPNHKLNFNSLVVTRYWPNKILEKKPLDDCAKDIAQYLTHIIDSISKKRKIIMAVTAGYDSRVLFAASKNIRNKTIYFIDKKSSMPDDDRDIRIGKEVVESKGLVFNINRHNECIDNIPKEFIDNYYASCFFAGGTQLPTVYYYYSNYSNYINLCGVGEIGRHRFGECVFKPTAGYLSYKYGYIKNNYAKEQAENWLNNNYNLCEKFNVNPYTLFYWEEDLGNWGAVGNSESDIAIEEINPYNSHYIFEIMLSVSWHNSKLRDNILFDKIIQTLDPDLLNIPINPDFKLTERIKRILMNSKVYQFLDFFKYLYVSR